MDIRLKFSRGREAMFISHLDLMRAFTRAFRRTDIPLAYSNGFNPHPLIVFGQPLQVGVTGDAEYMDFTTSSDVIPSRAADELNEQLPGGLRVISAALRPGSKNIMSEIAYATYEVDIEARDASLEKPNALSCAVDAFLLTRSFVVAKKTKAGEKDTDIRPSVKSVFADGEKRLIMTVRAGQDGNLKPETVVSALGSIVGDSAAFTISRVNRLALHVDRDGQPADPISSAVFLDSPAKSSPCIAANGSHEPSPGENPRI